MIFFFVFFHARSLITSTLVSPWLTLHSEILKLNWERNRALQLMATWSWPPMIKRDPSPVGEERSIEKPPAKLPYPLFWPKAETVLGQVENVTNYITNFSIRNINSQAVGIDSWVQSALKSILGGDPIFESSAWFFVIILKFIFTSILSQTAYKLISRSIFDEKSIYSKKNFETACNK